LSNRVGGGDKLADWKFDLWITNRAAASYERLKAIAEAAVPDDMGPLPLNSDPKLRARLAAINHYERTRRILKSIKDPRDASLDLSLLGVFYYVKYRTELGTCVYFTRLIDPPSVLVYDFSESPLDYDVLRKIIVSGNSNILARLRLPIPELNNGSVTIH
jgi:hypothetical protein